MHTSSACILLVDDALSNLMFLEDILHSKGYVTVLARSGKEALAIARQSCPDLVLLDLVMPEMDGFEVCQGFRADPSLQHVPIIFVSALDDEKSRLKGLDLLGDDYLTKPVQKDLVLAKVANVLQLNQLRGQQSQLRIRQQLQEESKRSLTEALEVNETLLEKLRLFVPEQLMDRIAPEGVKSIQLGKATEVEVTVMFCDIRNFTAIAESQQSSQTFEWLNAFFSRMDQAITSHNGFIDKYLGDAMMVVFDRPQHHIQDAFDAALQMQQTLDNFNLDRDQFNLEHPVNIGIGIHTGQAVIGTIGCDRRMDPTVIGDVVNTASRLEELTKLYNCQIIVSDVAVMGLKYPEQFDLRAIDHFAPRGKEQEISLYELVGAASRENIDFGKHGVRNTASRENIDSEDYELFRTPPVEVIEVEDYELFRTPPVEVIEVEDYELFRTPPVEVIEVEDYELFGAPPVEVIEAEDDESIKIPIVEVVDSDDDLHLKSAAPIPPPFLINVNSRILRHFHPVLWGRSGAIQFPLIKKYPLLSKVLHYFQHKWCRHINRHNNGVAEHEASLPQLPQPGALTSSSEPTEM